MNKFNERVNSISNDRKDALIKIKDSITNSYLELNRNIDYLISSSDVNSKEYNTLVKCKNVINDLINDISNAKSSTEITKIRRKLNYYITSIKNVMSKKEMSVEDAKTVSNNIDCLRSDITEYNRTLRRQSNIDKLSSISDYDSLSKEEKEKIRNIIKQEKRFNKRVLEKYTPEQIIQVVEKVIEDKETPLITKQRLSRFKRCVIACSVFGISLNFLLGATFQTTIADNENLEEDAKEKIEQMAKPVEEVIVMQNTMEHFSKPITYDYVENVVEVVPQVSLEEKEDKVMAQEQLYTYNQLYLLSELFMGDNPFGINYSSYEEVIDYLYENSSRSYEEKMLVIMARDNATYEELDTALGAVSAEAWGDGKDYVDAYAVTNTLFNRLMDGPYVNQYSFNMLNQIKAKGQWSVYANGTYKDYMGRIDLPTYQAGIDMLYSQIILHDSLEFRGNFVEVKRYKQYTNRGNKFMGRHVNPIDDEYFYGLNWIDQSLSPEEAASELIIALNEFYGNEESMTLSLG